MTNDDTTAYDYDVFISYTESDRDWVNHTLLEPLEVAGMDGCIDYRDFEPSAALLDEIERAICSSRKTLFVFSPAYLTSDWTLLEQWVLQTVDPANRKRRFLVVLRETCEIPLRLKPFIYVDFRDPEQHVYAYARLSRFLNRKLSSPTPEPGNNVSSLRSDALNLLQLLTTARMLRYDDLKTTSGLTPEAFVAADNWLMGEQMIGGSAATGGWRFITPKGRSFLSEHRKK